MGIIEVMLPIVFTALLGYLTVYRSIISQGQCDAVTRCTFTIFIPSLLFLGAATSELPSDFNWLFLLSYYIGVISVFTVACIVSRTILGYSSSAQSSFSVGAIYSNTTIVGIPVCLYAIGEQAIVPLFVLISVHTLLTFGMGILLAEWSKYTTDTIYLRLLKLVKSVVFNPIVGSLLLGSVVNISGLELNKFFVASLEFISQAALPLSLFVLGGSLNQYQRHCSIFPLIMMVMLKLVLLPLIVWLLCFHLFDIDILWASVALLVSAMPIGINAYFFSTKYAKNESLIGSSIVVSTVLSIITLSLLIIYVQSII